MVKWCQKCHGSPFGNPGVANSLHQLSRLLAHQRWVPRHTVPGTRVCHRIHREPGPQVEPTSAKMGQIWYATDMLHFHSFPKICNIVFWSYLRVAMVLSQMWVFFLNFITWVPNLSPKTPMCLFVQVLGIPWAHVENTLQMLQRSQRRHLFNTAPDQWRKSKWRPWLRPGVCVGVPGQWDHRTKRGSAGLVK